MTGPTDADLLAEAMRRLRDARAEAAAARAPVAVLGMGFRLPGDHADPAGLWSALLAGADEIRDLAVRPDGRRPAGGGAPYGALSHVDGFDADFFGLSDAEADHLDPQQRLVLETAWEAAEDAGVPAEELRDRTTGVFLGVYNSDWLLLQHADQDLVGPHTGPGAAHSMVANRLSYLLDLTGPSLAVDTACSSSLTALHLAVRALRAGDCDLALVGGVNLVLSPFSSAVTGKVLPLAPAGRCRSFDAGAEGIVRAEGCGVLLLERAGASARRPRALVRGTAVNQDGRSSGLTAPNARAQRAVLERALADAGEPAERVGYVEAHGTGTILGDPIEMDAIRDVYGAGDRPCSVGSVKANLGHLEAAAGVAGLIKAILVLEHGVVPPQPHLSRLNPEIDLTGSRLSVPATAMPLPPTPEPPLAAVSSFGFGGANAHVVLEAAPVPPEPAGRPEPAVAVLPLSARAPGALPEIAAGYRAALAAGVTPDDLRAAAAHGRSHHPYRLAVTGPDPDRALAELPALPARPVPAHPELVFVYSGQGAQWPGMARDLLDRPVFREALAGFDAEVAARAGWSPLEQLAAGPADRLDRTEVAQVCTVAVQLALTELLRSWGLAPDAVVGHSAGEVAAAAVAGALDRGDAVTVLRERARLTEARAGGGGLLAVALPEAEVGRHVADLPGLGVAAVNGPAGVVVGGSAGQLEVLAARLTGAGVRIRRLPARYGFHSPLLDGADEALAAALVGLSGTPMLPFHSTVTGERHRKPLDGDYWGRNLRAPVRFADALRGLPARPGRVLVEIGPHPVLLGDVRATLPDTVAVASLRRDRPGPGCLDELVARAYEAGLDPDWGALLPPPAGRVRLPSYPWQRRRHWLPTGARGPEPAGDRAAPAGTRTERVARLCADLRGRFAAALALPVEEVAADVPLEEWGLESAALLEIRDRMERELGIDVPLAVLLRGGAPTAVAEALAGPPEPRREQEQDRLAGLLDRLDELDDHDIDAALRALQEEGRHD